MNTQAHTNRSHKWITYTHVCIYKIHIYGFAICSHYYDAARSAVATWNMQVDFPLISLRENLRHFAVGAQERTNNFVSRVKSKSPLQMNKIKNTVKSIWARRGNSGFVWKKWNFALSDAYQHDKANSAFLSIHFYIRKMNTPVRVCEATYSWSNKSNTL